MGYAQSMILYHPKTPDLSGISCLVPFGPFPNLFVLHLGVTYQLRTLSVNQKRALALLESLGFQGYCLQTQKVFRLWQDLAEKRETRLENPVGGQNNLMLLGGLFLCPNGPDLALW